MIFFFLKKILIIIIINNENSYENIINQENIMLFFMKLIKFYIFNNKNVTILVNSSITNSIKY